MKRIFWALLMVSWMAASQAQVQGPREVRYSFIDEKYTDGKPISLEGFEYQPKQWNGKVIVFLHGSTGGSIDSKVIKESIRYLNISKYALENGYLFLPFMRKGRGKSDGDFTEEQERCGWGSTLRQVDEAERQVAQVLRQVREKYAVDKVILMGHSRGGLLSAFYAAKHPGEVAAVVNLAGVWNAACEYKGGGMASRNMLENAAKQFKPQFWAYFEQDSYFLSDTFNDPKYEWLGKVAADHGLVFKVFPSGPRPDGHDTPTWFPKAWASEYFPLLNAALAPQS